MENLTLEQVMGNIPEMISKTIESTLRPFTEVQKPVFGNNDEKELFYTETRQFLNDLKNNIIKAQQVSSDSQGGYLVPRITVKKIFEYVYTYGQARKLFTQFPLSESGKTDIIYSADDVNDMATVRSELGAVSDTTYTLSRIQLDVAELVKAVIISNKLLKYEITNELVDWIIQKVARAFARREDQLCFQNGNTTFTGLFYSGNTFGDSEAFSGYDSLINAVYGIDQALLAGAEWVMHRSTFAELRKLKDSTGQPLLYVANDGTKPQLLGYPVNLVEFAPVYASSAGTPIMILGNFKNSFFAVEQDVVFKWASEGTVGSINLLTQGAQALIASEFFAFHPGFTQTYVALTVPTP